MVVRATVLSYQNESFSSKWELPRLPPSSLELWRRERASMQLSFWLKTLILIGHCGIAVGKPIHQKHLWYVPTAGLFPQSTLGYLCCSTRWLQDICRSFGSLLVFLIVNKNPLRAMALDIESICVHWTLDPSTNCYKHCRVPPVSKNKPDAPAESEVSSHVHGQPKSTQFIHRLA